MAHTPITPDSAAGVLIQRLGYAGLIPFASLALLMWIVTPEAHPLVAIALTSYAATICAFLGGIHWGIGLRHNAPSRKLHMVWGVVPSLVAWIGVMMPAYAGLPVLAVLLVPSLSDQAITLIGPVASAGFVVAMPVAFLVAKKINRVGALRS